MRQHLFKLFLLSLLCAAWPGRVGAEVMRLTSYSECSAQHNTGRQGVWKWEKPSPKKRPFWKALGLGGKQSSRIWAILVIIALLLLALGILGLSIGYLIESFRYPTEFPFLFLIFPLAVLAWLGFVLVSRIQKLKNTKGQMPPRAPSQKMNSK